MIRHAEAEGNIYRRAHGHFNGQVTIRGHKQIECLKERFADETIDAVYSSDLSRACVTAAGVSDPHGLTINKTEMLREVKMGIWEDHAWGGMEHDDPEMSGLFGKDPARWHVEGSEEYHNVQSRMTQCITDIARRHDGGAVAVFSHGFAIRAFMCAVLDISSFDTATVSYCDNTAVTLLTYDNDKLSIEYQSDNSHLSDELSTFARQTWWRSENEWRKENLRFRLLDESIDAAIIEKFYSEEGQESRECNDSTAGLRAQTEFKRKYAAFLTDDPIGYIEIDISGGQKAGIEGQTHDSALKSDEEDKAGIIDYIFVDKEHRLRNYGIQLIGQAVADFRRLRFEIIRIRVQDNNPAFSFFEKAGFKTTGKSGAINTLETGIRNW